MIHEIQHEDLSIEYKITDDSFNHEFGKEKQHGFEIVRVIQDSETFKADDITNKLCDRMYKKIMKLIERDYENMSS